MRTIIAVSVIIAPAVALAAPWTPAKCGSAPRAPAYDLSTRAKYNEGVAKANAYAAAAKAYAACVLSTAHDDETAVSQAAQNRIAEIQAEAVARQQAIYARLAAQADAFRQAAQKLAH